MLDFWNFHYFAIFSNFYYIACGCIIFYYTANYYIPNASCSWVFERDTHLHNCICLICLKRTILLHLSNVFYHIALLLNWICCSYALEGSYFLRPATYHFVLLPSFTIFLICCIVFSQTSLDSLLRLKNIFFYIKFSLYCMTYNYISTILHILVLIEYFSVFRIQ